MATERTSDCGPFAELLRQHRAAANLTQEELAERSGVSVHAISMLERGMRRCPRPSTIEFLAGALRLDGQQREALVAAARRRPEAPAAPAAATRTLPRDIAAFTGREAELARLAGRAAGITAVDGMAGVGKTAFAVHAAHLLAPLFPDGQLFLDLRGHAAGQRPVKPADALENLLVTTGVAPQVIPRDVDARAAMWRDRLAGKRLLMLLDDAASHEQVRPVLPGAGSCLVLVTSRRRMAALEDVESVTLDPMSDDDAAALIGRLAGVRTTAEPAAVAELLSLCGGLPLAIMLLGGRLRSHPSWSVRHLADTLRDAQDRLAEMSVENRAIESVFDLSYQDVPNRQRQLFRRLGLHPGPDIDAHAAAALDGAGPAETRRHLDALYYDHLIQETLPGRYRLHDLIRSYARALASHDDVAETEAAVARLHTYYKRAALDASRVFGERGEPSRLREARIWLETERPNLAACVDDAARRGRYADTVQLAGAMHAFFVAAGHWDQARDVQRTAFEAAARAGDRTGWAAALVHLATIQRLTGDYRAAEASLTEALSHWRDLGDEAGIADALKELGRVQRLTGDFANASASLTGAVRLYSRCGDRLGGAAALAFLAHMQHMIGGHEPATAELAQAVAILRELGSPFALVAGLINYGGVMFKSGDLAAGIAAYAEAVTLSRAVGDRMGQANGLAGLGFLQCETGEYAGALVTLREAFTAYQDLGHPLGQADTLHSLGMVECLTGAHQAAIGTLTGALDLFRNVGNPLGRARALRGLARARGAMGDADAATAHLMDALAVSRELGDTVGQAEALNHLGELDVGRGCHDKAIGHHRAALGLAVSAGVPMEEARALEGIGRCLVRKGEMGEGVARLRQALERYRRLGVPERERVAAELAELGDAPEDASLAPD